MCVLRTVKWSFTCLYAYATVEPTHCRRTKHVPHSKVDRRQTARDTTNCKVGKSLSQQSNKDQQIKINGSLFEQADEAIHVKAGTKLIIEAGMEVTIKGGRGFVKMDPSGVTIQGSMVKINSGGSASSAIP